MSCEEELEKIHRLMPMLKQMVEMWVDEGFTAEPYDDEEYDVFEWLGVTSRTYDVRRWPLGDDT